MESRSTIPSIAIKLMASTSTSTSIATNMMASTSTAKILMASTSTAAKLMASTIQVQVPQKTLMASTVQVQVLFKSKSKNVFQDVYSQALIKFVTFLWPICNIICVNFSRESRWIVNTSHWEPSLSSLTGGEIIISGGETCAPHRARLQGFVPGKVREGASPRKFWNFNVLKCSFLHSEGVSNLKYSVTSMYHVEK